MNKRLVPLLLLAGLLATGAFFFFGNSNDSINPSDTGSNPENSIADTALEQAELANTSDIPLPDPELQFEPMALDRSELANAALIVDVMIDAQGTPAEQFDLFLIDSDEKVTTLSNRSEHVGLASIQKVKYVCARGPAGWSKMLGVEQSEEVNGTPHLRVVLDQARTGFIVNTSTTEGQSTAAAELVLKADDGVAKSFLQSNPGRATLHADASGTFRFDGLPAVVYAATLTLADHVPLLKTIDLSTGIEQSLEFTFQPAGGASGRVVSNGIGLAEATVALWPSDFQDNIFGLALDNFRSAGEIPNGVADFHQVVSDVQGNFKFNLAKPGEYQLLIAAKGFLPRVTSAKYTVTARANTDCGDQELELGFGINLLVIDSVAMPIAAVKVSWYRSAGNNLIEARRRRSVNEEITNKLGIVLLRGLPAEQIMLELSHPDYARVVLEHDFSSRSNKTDEPMEVVMQVGASVAGSVIDGSTGMPIANAALELHTSENSQGFGAVLRGADWDATSGQDGKFSFAHLPSDEYILIAKHENFAETRSNPIDVGVSAVENEVIIMHPGATLTVTVLDSEGVGIGAATVQAVNAEAQHIRSEVTNDNGIIVFENLLPGNYQVAFTDISGYDTKDNTGSLDVRFKFINIEEGEDAEVTLGGPSLSADVEGVVRRGSEVMQGATVAIITDSGIKTDSTNVEGSFKIEDVPLGEYTIMVRAGMAFKGGSTFYDHITIHAQGTQRYDLDMPDEGVEVLVFAASDRKPLAGIPVSVRPMDGSNISGGDFSLTDADGTVKFPSLPNGRYIIAAGNATASFLAASETGFGSVQKSNVVIQEGSGVQTFEMPLQLGCSFKVLVSDPEGNSLSGAHMHYLDLEGQPLNILSVTGTNSKGVAAMTGLPPGPGIILVRHPLLGSKEIPVNLEVGKEAKQRVQLDRGTIIYLTITNQDGTPMAGILATALDSRGAPLSYLWSQEETQATNAAFFSGGEQKLGPLADGEYMIQLYRPGSPPVRHSLTIHGQREMHLSLPYSAE